jgi:uncharacterized protein (TIGR03437 family)
MKAIWAAAVVGLLPWGLHAQGIVLGAGYSAPRPVDVAPGQVITVFVRIPGKTPADPAKATPPLPTALSGFSAQLRQSFGDPMDAPLVSVADSQSCSNLGTVVCDTTTMVTVQIPYELNPNVPGTMAMLPPNLARLDISYNGAAASSLFLNPVMDRVHVLNSCDVAANLPLGDCLPVVTHADGSLVSIRNQAQPGEELTVAMVGLGWAVEKVTTGAASPDWGPLVDGVTTGISTRTNAAPDLPDPASAATTARLRPGSVGVYEVKFMAPGQPPTTACSSSVRSNLTVSIGRTASYDGAAICVDGSAMMQMMQ